MSSGYSDRIGNSIVSYDNNEINELLAMLQQARALSNSLQTALTAAQALPSITLSTVARTGLYSDLIGIPAPYSLAIASSNTLGGVKIGSGINIASDGTISATGNVSSFNSRTGAIAPQTNDYSISQIAGASRVASTGAYGDLLNLPSLSTVATTGSFNDLSNLPAPYILPPATNSAIGGVKPGTGLTVTADGTLTVSAMTAGVTSFNGRYGAVTPASGDYTYAQIANTPAAYALPIASNTVLGGIKVGSNLSIANDGTLSSSGAVQSVFGRTGAVTAAANDYSISQISGASAVASSGKFNDLLSIPSLVNTFNGRSGAVVPASGDYTAAQVGAPAGSGTSTGTNTGDQTSVSGNAGTVSTINGLVAAGSGTTLTGTGTNADPYKVNASSSGGSVTSVSVASANGFAGTVANANTTPSITISTSVSGLLKGNGTAMSNAVAGTDYQIPISLTTTGSSGAATYNASTGVINIPNYSTGSGTTTNTFNTKHVAMAGATGTDTEAFSTGTINGTTTDFVTAYAFASGSGEVELNGVPQIQGTSTTPNDWYPVNSTTIRMAVPPATGDVLTFSYNTPNTSTGSLPEGYRVVSGTATMNGSTDKNMLMDTSSGPCNLTLPNAVTFDGARYRFKNISTGAFNNIAKLIPAVTGQTVDGSASRTIKVNEGFSLVAEGGVWQVQEAYYPGTWQTIYSIKTFKTADTVGATATETNFASSGLIPANSMVPGSVYEIVFRGKYSTPTLSGPSTTARVKLGSTPIVATVALTNPNGANDFAYSGTVLFTCTATGTSGSVIAGGTLTFQSAAAGSATPSVTVPVTDTTTTINTTIDQAVYLSVQFSAATAGNSNTLTQFLVRETRPVLGST